MKRLFITVWLELLVLSGCLQNPNINNSLSEIKEKEPCTTAKELSSKIQSPYYQTSPIGREDLPFVIKVSTNKGVCSGTIIGNCTILTAAHCIPRNENSIRIITDREIYDEIQWIEKYPFYFRPTIDDLAIIRLKHSISNIIPVPLDIEKITIGEEIVIAGFGSREIALPIKTIGENTITVVNSREIEIRGPGRNIMPGDSGGPVLRKRKHIYSQIAINIEYEKGAPPGKERSFALTIRDYIDFILDKTFDDIYFLQYDIEEYK